MFAVNPLINVPLFLAGIVLYAVGICIREHIQYRKRKETSVNRRTIKSTVEVNSWADSMPTTNTEGGVAA